MSTPSLVSASPATRRPSPFRGRWLWATIFVIAGCLVMCRLGIWQLDRLRQREAANAQLLTRLNQPPLSLSGAAVDPVQADLRRAVVRGAFDYSQEIVLRSQAYNGAPGVHFITPLRIAGSDAAVLVDRGWVPVEQSDPKARAAFTGPTGEVEVRGIARQAQTRQSTLTPDDPNPSGPNDRADAWFRVNIGRIQQQVPYRLLPVYVQQGEPNTSGNPVASFGRLPVPDIEIDLSNGPHLGYAIQWFSFAAILAGGYVLLYRRRALELADPQKPEEDLDLGPAGGRPETEHS